MTDIGLGQIEDDKDLNFKLKYDEDKEIYTDNMHSCEYFEMSDFKNNFSKHIDSFSSYSHNIRSINGHWDDILDIVNPAKPINFLCWLFSNLCCSGKVVKLSNTSRDFSNARKPLSLYFATAYFSSCMRN